MNAETKEKLSLIIDLYQAGELSLAVAAEMYDVSNAEIAKIFFEAGVEVRGLPNSVGDATVKPIKVSAVKTNTNFDDGYCLPSADGNPFRPGSDIFKIFNLLKKTGPLHIRAIIKRLDLDSSYEKRVSLSGCLNKYVKNQKGFVKTGPAFYGILA